MSSEATTKSADAEGVQPPESPRDDAMIVAFSPSEMEAAQGRLAGWFEYKLGEARKELAEAKANYDQAVKAKWRASPFLSIMKRLERQITFYEKAHDAVAAGYMLIPSLDMNAFAIRTDAGRPAAHKSWAGGRHLQTGSPALSSGEGRYVSNVPVVREKRVDTVDSDGKREFHYESWASEYCVVEFPLELARPAIMAATHRAMALKIFDEMGIVVDARKMRKGDPIIIGKVLNPRRNRPDLAFFICWALDPTSI